MKKTAAIYAHVSSDRQKENHTIASQMTALIEYAQTHGYLVPPEWHFQDEGYSGPSLQRPGLEGLLSLEELRQRIPDLRKQQEAHDSEIQSLQTASIDQDRYLSLMESLSEFGERLKSKANTLDVLERQKILRLLVKEVLVNDDSIKWEN